jgi:hypothetical protein
VDAGFPRLTRQSFWGGLPAGVRDVTYALDLAACARWRLGTRPSDREMDFLRA